MWHLLIERRVGDAMDAFERLRRLISLSRRDNRASVATVFGLALPVMFLATATAVQYGSMVQQRSSLQAAADAGALGAARQLGLASGTNVQSASSAAVSIALATLANQHPSSSDQITASLVDSDHGVDVTIVRTVPSYFSGFLGSSSYTLRAHSLAHLVGGIPICAIALDPGIQGAVTLDTSAIVDAKNCAVYSNSKNSLSINADQNSILKSGLTCAVGGKAGSFPNFSPQPKTGCPAISDPLAAIPAPNTQAACDFTSPLNSAGPGLHLLMPGRYCGGLKVLSGQTASLAPGIYVIDGGPLEINNGATLTGQNVGFFLTDSKTSAPAPKAPKPGPGPGPAVAGPASGTTIYFAPSSSISLTAPKAGSDMAGLLFFEDRKLPANQLHQIMSNQAQTLTGTIYLPKGRLYVGSSAPISASSNFTVIVANTLELSAGPTLVLNSDYGSTDIPVPKGVGPQGGGAILTQ